MLRTLLVTTALAALMTVPARAQDAQTATDADAAANVTVETTGEPEVIVETVPTDGQQQTTTAPAQTTIEPTAQQQTTTAQPAQLAQQGLDMAQGYQPQPTDQLASNLMGMTVYSTLQDPNIAAAAGGAGGAGVGTAGGAAANGAISDPAAAGAAGAGTVGGVAAGGATADPAAGAVGGAGAADPTVGREAIGDISDLVLDETGQVKAVVLGVGGFLGIGERNIAVDFAQLRWVAGQDGSQVLMMDTTREALEAAPELNTDQIGQAVNTDAGAVQNLQTTTAQ